MTKDEALDLALEELENCADLLKVFEAPIDSCVGATMLQAEKAITAIKQARSALVQEPVAWINAEKRTFEWNGPVLWNTPTVAVLNKIPLYTTPPAAQRQWVGLTDDEKRGVCRVGPVYAPDGVVTRTPLEYRKELEGVALMAVRQAEAKLKEKNI